METFCDMIVLTACGCVLPIVVVWLVIRHRMNETNSRTQIALAAIEKNPDMDIEELLKKFSHSGKLLKEKLLTKLLWGCLAILLGIGLIVQRDGRPLFWREGLKSDIEVLVLEGVIGSSAADERPCLIDALRCPPSRHVVKEGVVGNLEKP